jgi:hypothetical protein
MILLLFTYFICSVYHRNALFACCSCGNPIYYVYISAAHVAFGGRGKKIKSIQVSNLTVLLHLVALSYLEATPRVVLSGL